MSKRVVILLGFLVLLVETLQAQPYHYSLRNYKAVDGLPQSQVRFMVEDKNGYLWIGTEGGGLARFDGRNFHVYTTLDGLQSNIVTSLFIDSKQNLWIVHPRGLTRFDGMEFRRFEKAGSRQSTTKLRRVLEYQDTIFFFSSPGYMGKIYGDSIYYWSKPIAERKEGQHEPLITFARQFGKAILFCMNNKSFYCRTPQENFWIRFDNQFNYIKKTFDYKGQLWMATDSGYFSVDLKGRTIKREELPVKNAIIQYDSIHDVFYTRNVTSFHKETIKDGTVKIDTVFRDIEVDQVLVDSEGNTWFGSNGNGLYKYFVQDFDHCGSEKMRNVMAIFRDGDGAIWIGTHNRGVYRIKKGKIGRYSFPADATKNSVFSIAQDPEGTIWIGGGGGLGKYNNVKDEFEWPAFQSGPWRPSIVSIQFDDKGAMWVGTVGGGVYRMTGNQVSNFSVDNGLETNMVMSLLYSPFYKKVFVGDEFGLSSITNNTAARINIPGLDNTTIISMSQYKDSVLLLSTAGAGLIIYNPHSQFKKFITTKEGLASDFIYFGAADNDGYFWVGTEKGITRIRFDQYFNVEDHIHFDYENGLTGVEANQNAYCFSDGNKYFGLIDGLYQYNDPERIVTKVFDLHLTQIQLLYGEEPITEYCDYTTGFFHIPVNLVLPPDKNHITFHFNRVWKSNPKSIKFKYFLQGFDKTCTFYKDLTRRGRYLLQFLKLPIVIFLPGNIHFW
jgi:ligand-binding sensor domain-containing protein